MRRIIETGHYYTIKGPTIWSKKGWEIFDKIATPWDESLLFIDDYHTNIESANYNERNSPVSIYHHKADHVYYENSEIIRQAAKLALELLFNLPKKKRPHRKVNGEVYLYSKNKIPLITTDGNPSCVLLDAGLSLIKYELGFKHAINILPHYYASEQENLKTILKRILPELTLEVILYDLKTT